MTTATIPAPTAAAPPPALLTAEEFFSKPWDRQAELIDGEVVDMPPTGFRHGYVCGNVQYELRRLLETTKLGRVVCNDAGIVTRRRPDTVRGPDVAYFSYVRLPQDLSPAGYPDVSPELVFEVKSPSDRWDDLLAKVAEYLRVNVVAVVVLDPDEQTVQIFRREQSVQTFGVADVLELPDILLGFCIPVERLFQ